MIIHQNVMTTLHHQSVMITAANVTIIQINVIHLLTSVLSPSIANEMLTLQEIPDIAITRVVMHQFLIVMITHHHRKTIVTIINHLIQEVLGIHSVVVVLSVVMTEMLEHPVQQNLVTLKLNRLKVGMQNAQQLRRHGTILEYHRLNHLVVVWFQHQLLEVAVTGK